MWTSDSIRCQLLLFHLCNATLRSSGLLANVPLLAGRSLSGWVRWIASLGASAVGRFRPDFEQLEFVIDHFFVAAQLSLWGAANCAGGYTGVRKSQHPAIVDVPVARPDIMCRTLPCAICGLA